MTAMTTNPKRHARRTWSAVAAALAFAGASVTSTLPAAAADTVMFTSTLSSSAEVPPNTSGGSGTLEATLDQGTRELSWKATYTGLSGPATMAHFHGPAMPGANAGVVLPFKEITSPLSGKATLTAEQVADLMAGKWYANVHTAQNPGGEIRGQVMVKK